MKKRLLWLVATAGVVGLSFTPVHAGTSQTTLVVGAEVIADCKVVGGALDFGSYVTGQSKDHEAVGSIDYEGCLIGSVVLELSGGQSGSIADRAMLDGNGKKLKYQIYRDAGYSQVWGQGSGAHSINLTKAGGGSVEVYGRIPGRQSVARGNYSDTVSVTLMF